MRVDIGPLKGKEGFISVTPHGSIDSDTYTEFQEKIKPALVPSTKNILVDLGHVEYISSAGLGVLFGIKKSLAGTGGELYFCNLKPQIKRLFEIVKALPKETLFTSYEEADRYFYKVMNDEIERRKGSSPDDGNA